MEQTFPYLWNAFNANIDWVIVLLVIAAGYSQKLYLKDFILNEALKTLLLSFLFSGVYLLLAGDLNNKASLAKFFFSFILATSFYDILLKPISQKLIGNQKRRL